jgi:hypothetical protein
MARQARAAGGSQAGAEAEWCWNVRVGSVEEPGRRERGLGLSE